MVIRYKIIFLIFLCSLLTNQTLGQDLKHKISSLSKKNGKILLKHKRPFRNKICKVFVADKHYLELLDLSLNKLFNENKTFCKIEKNRIYQAIGVKHKSVDYLWINSISLKGRSSDLFMKLFNQNLPVLISDGSCMCISILFDIAKKEFVIVQANSIA